MLLVATIGDVLARAFKLATAATFIPGVFPAPAADLPHLAGQAASPRAKGTRRVIAYVSYSVAYVSFMNKVRTRQKCRLRL
jgi:hypothetical protein